jgi:hypothetical protein
MDLPTQLRRYGPLGAAAVVAVIVVAIVVVGGGDDEPSADDDVGADESGYVVETEWGGSVTLPEGVIPFSVAEDEGLDIDWPETCDTERGVAAVPNFFAPECYAPFEGDNGGSTAQGVTEDTIKVVLYEAIENDPILEAITGLVSDDTPADLTATYQEFLAYFHDYYETYGREVELIVYEGTGDALDEVAARADAVEIAERIQPFAVFDGPQLTSAFADELAAQGVLHIGLLGGGEQPEYYTEADPYLFQLGMAPNQGRQHVAEYIGKRLAGDVAEHAGDEALAEQERRFGLVYLETGPAADQVLADFENGLAEHGVELAAVASYENPLDVSAVAPGVIAEMKDAGVTSLILVGDPLTPATFTRTATDQDYFPEWVLAGSPFADTAAYARTYDQEQWAHAFGVSFGAARRDPTLSSGYQLFRWYTCSEPPAGDGVELVSPIPSLFFAVIQAVGPDLTHQRFRDIMFAADPTQIALTAPSLSWGPPEKGRWDEVDYQGVDDATEIWWDPEATGPDETGAEGTGMYRYVDGGTRYLPGGWPESPPAAFEEEGSVTIYTQPPAGETYPDYPSPCEGS